jgi:hypothetical protein
MASYYVRSGAGGSANGTSWANAYLTLAAAFSGKAAGDTFYVSEDHAETQASTITLTSPGTLANPCKVVCVDHAGSVPPVSADLRTTGTITASGANVMNLGGSAYVSGITLSAGVTLQLAVDNQIWVFKDSSLRLSGAGGGSIGFTGGLQGSASVLRLINTTLKFGGTGQTLNVITGTFQWYDTPSAFVSGGTIPTTVFTFTATRSALVDVRGVDLSAVGSGKTLFGNGASTGPIIGTLQNCKIDAAVTIAATPSTPGCTFIDTWRVGASGVNYNQGRYRYEGSLVEETTIVRSGGASNGTTGISWKIVTTANSSWFVPFESPPIDIWNDTTGSSVTATVEGIWGGGSVPNNDDIWIEAEYLGGSGSPQSSFVNCSKADALASNAGLTTSTVTWGGSTTKFKMAVTFTPQQKGWVRIRVKAAKTSSTFYIDPKVTLS